MNSLDKDYLSLVSKILVFGSEKSDRTGTGTYSLFGEQIKHDMETGFPLLTTKDVWFKGVVHELLWFLNGDTNIKYLVDNNVNIWNDWCYDNYVKFAKNIEEPDYEYHVDDPMQNCTRLMTQEEFVEKIKRLSIDHAFVQQFGDLGPIYGKQWVNWNSIETNFNVSQSLFEKYPCSMKITTEPGINQIKEVIENLKTNPYSRRHLVSAWNVEELDKMALVPCHYSFQFNVTDIPEDKLSEYDGKTKYLSLLWNQRSVDVGLGLPFNIASYGLLLMMIAKEVKMIPKFLIGNLGDTHIYKNHKEQLIEQTKRDYTKYDLPKVELNMLITSIFDYTYKDIKLFDYKHLGKLPMPISV